jgi:hypothetical protein
LRTDESLAVWGDGQGTATFPMTQAHAAQAGYSRQQVPSRSVRGDLAAGSSLTAHPPDNHQPARRWPSGKPTGTLLLVKEAKGRPAQPLFLTCRISSPKADMIFRIWPFFVKVLPPALEPSLRLRYPTPSDVTRGQEMGRSQLPLVAKSRPSPRDAHVLLTPFLCRPPPTGPLRLSRGRPHAVRSLGPPRPAHRSPLSPPALPHSPGLHRPVPGGLAGVLRLPPRRGDLFHCR